MTIEQEFIDRLKTMNPPVFAIVEGAAEFAVLADRPIATPAAYVMIEAEASEPSERATGPVLQLCQVDVAIIIFTENVSDATGAAGAADIASLKAQVRGRVIGFVPATSQDGEPVQHISGELLKARNGVVVHKELYATSHFLEEQQ